ncbi:hypothetical protein XENTR_v10006507 [Xenopus tropicalis]|nr:hypothetical protein XENTR_v10006507 [Xenopus tropicalis]
MDSQLNSKKRKLEDFQINKKMKREEESRDKNPTKEIKPRESNALGFTAMFFAAFRSLHRKLKETFIASAWAKTEKSVKNEAPQRKRKAEQNCKEGEDLPNKKKRGENPKAEAKRGALSPPGTSGAIASAAASGSENMKSLVPFPTQGVKRPRAEEPTEGTVKRLRGENQEIDEPKLQPAPSASALPVGPTGLLNSFNFYKILGKGGYGKVLLARELVTKQLVAVKVVEKNILLNSVASIMIEKEILEAAMDCKFLTEAFAAFHTEDNIYFVMDYLSGGSLYDFYQQNKPLNINTIRFLAAEMICGLKSLHSLGYIHRDLKLGNVLLDSRGHAKIADFGLAAHMINGKAKGCVGTRGYVAPEVLYRDEYDYTVDYYSLGVTLFRMATGLKLEQEPTPESKAQIHSMSPELRDFILKLVCDNPEERMRFVCSIKDHPFLGPIDWEALESGKLKPPYIMPQPKKLGESVPYGTLMQSKGEKIPLTTSQQELFRGISFVRNCNT